MEIKYKGKTSMKELLKLANDDYQKRGGNYPKSDVPDSIAVEIAGSQTVIAFDFKNTDDTNALLWYEHSKEHKIINKFSKDYDIAVTASQDGDYEDDWKKLTVLLNKKDLVEQTLTTKETTTQKADDTGYTYCYILSTLEQREKLDLTKHKAKMVKTITAFFAERLISVEIYKDHYQLKLKDTYEVSDKRRLGRLISENCDLTSYVRKVHYNNRKDTSGQLFRVCKDG